MDGLWYFFMLSWIFLNVAEEEEEKSSQLQNFKFQLRKHLIILEIPLSARHFSRIALQSKKLSQLLNKSLNITKSLA